MAFLCFISLIIHLVLQHPWKMFEIVNFIKFYTIFGQWPWPNYTQYSKYLSLVNNWRAYILLSGYFDTSNPLKCHLIVTYPWIKVKIAGLCQIRSTTLNVIWPWPNFKDFIKYLSLLSLLKCICSILQLAYTSYLLLCNNSSLQESKFGGHL